MNLPIKHLAVVSVFAAFAATGVVVYADHGAGRKASKRPVVGPASREVRAGPRFVDYRGTRLPTSPVAGPWYQRDGLAAGFSHSRLGALMAAVHIYIRTTPVAGAKVVERTVARQLIGPGKGAMLAWARSGFEAVAHDQEPATPALLARGDAVIEAFRWIGYSPDAATVELVDTLLEVTGNLVRRCAYRIGLRWVNGDWKVLAPPRGQWSNLQTTLRSLKGYTLFQQAGWSL